MTQQQDGSRIVTSVSQLLYKVFKNSLFISADNYEKYIVNKNDCIARHDDKMCSYPSVDGTLYK